jgi:hypothetical protein
MKGYNESSPFKKNIGCFQSLIRVLQKTAAKLSLQRFLSYQTKLTL